MAAVSICRRGYVENENETIVDEIFNEEYDIKISKAVFNNGNDELVIGVEYGGDGATGIHEEENYVANSINGYDGYSYNVNGTYGFVYIDDGKIVFIESTENDEIFKEIII